MLRILRHFPPALVLASSVVACSSAGPRSASQAASNATEAGALGDGDGGVPGIYWGVRSQVVYGVGVELYLDAFTLLKSGELLATVPPIGAPADLTCEAEIVAELQRRPSPVACVPFTLENDVLTAHFSGSTEAWHMQPDGAMQPDGWDDPDRRFRRVETPRYTAMAGTYGAFSYRPGVGASTSGKARLTLRADGTFDAFGTAAVFSDDTTAKTNAIEGSYAIDGLTLRLELARGEMRTLRFLPLSSMKGDEAPPFLFVEGLGYLTRDSGE